MHRASLSACETWRPLLDRNTQAIAAEFLRLHQVIALQEHRGNVNHGECL